MKRLNAILAALAVAVPFSANAAVSILFDADGSGGVYSPVSVSTFDWQPGSALAVKGNGISTGDSTQLLFQANLGTVTDTSSAIKYANGLGGPFITAVAGFWETATVGATNASFTFDSVKSGTTLSANNFFYIYANAAVANNLAGTGFVGTGSPILSAHISVVNSSNFTYSVDGSGNPVPTQLLDQSPNGNQWGTTQTAVGSGATDLVLVIDSVNTAYFPTLVSGTSISLGMTNTSQVDPFQQVDPSRAFSSNGTTGANYNANVGTVNGFNNGTGTDFIFQADANLSFDTATVPEPGSIALIGAALLAAGAASRRRRA